MEKLKEFWELKSYIGRKVTKTQGKKPSLKDIENFIIDNDLYGLPIKSEKLYVLFRVNENKKN